MESPFRFSESRRMFMLAVMEMKELDNASQDNRRMYSVGELTRIIKSVLEDEIGMVWVEGEVSNLRKPASGHLYFTLKDDAAQIPVVFFRGSQRNSRVVPRDGMQIRVQGDVTVYMDRGQYQVVARKVEEAGKGSLQEAFEKLKARLAEEGLFDPGRKKPLPLLPRHIGVVTSRTGAAVRDILNILTRRFPDIHVVLAPVKVQGDGAAEEIAAAIDLLNRREDLDVLIVGRGGGSLEDLWAFNEEATARAIARSNLPVISAVGHEIDFTISDFVADLRAPTPSAAAELVIGTRQSFVDLLEGRQRQLADLLQRRVVEFQRRVDRAANSYVFREPGNLLRGYRQDIEGIRFRLATSLKGAYAEVQQRLDEADMKLMYAVRSIRRDRQQQLERMTSQLRALNPLAVLQRGYSVTRRKDGSVITRPDDVTKGDEIETLIAGGSLTSTVTQSSKEKHHGQG